jgi:hypothetical protein
MEANPYSKYALKDVHQSIDLIDRKITHCRNFEKLDSAEIRESALRKLSTKREALAKQRFPNRSWNQIRSRVLFAVLYPPGRMRDGLCNPGRRRER